MLRHTGFGDTFCNWVKLLYMTPKASIRINGRFSDCFSLFCGTRQGFPLSPLLFPVVIEPLLALLRQMAEVRGVCRGKYEEKIALSADDVLLYLADSQGSLVASMSAIEKFGTYFGSRIR